MEVTPSSRTLEALCLKVTIEQHDDGTGVLYQVAQHPMDQVYLYTRHSRPCLPTLSREPGTGLSPVSEGIKAIKEKLLLGSWTYKSEQPNTQQSSITH